MSAPSGDQPEGDSENRETFIDLQSYCKESSFFVAGGNEGNFPNFFTQDDFFSVVGNEVNGSATEIDTSTWTTQAVLNTLENGAGNDPFSAATTQVEGDTFYNLLITQQDTATQLAALGDQRAGSGNSVNVGSIIGVGGGSDYLNQEAPPVSTPAATLTELQSSGPVAALAMSTPPAHTNEEVTVSADVQKKARKPRGKNKPKAAKEVQEIVLIEEKPTPAKKTRRSRKAAAVTEVKAPTVIVHHKPIDSVIGLNPKPVSGNIMNNYGIQPGSSYYIMSTGHSQLSVDHSAPSATTVASELKAIRNGLKSANSRRTSAGDVGASPQAAGSSGTDQSNTLERLVSSKISNVTGPRTRKPTVSASVIQQNMTLYNQLTAPKKHHSIVDIQKLPMQKWMECPNPGISILVNPPNSGTLQPTGGPTNQGCAEQQGQQVAQSSTGATFGKPASATGTLNGTLSPANPIARRYGVTGGPPGHQAEQPLPIGSGAAPVRGSITIQSRRDADTLLQHLFHRVQLLNADNDELKSRNYWLAKNSRLVGIRLHQMYEENEMLKNSLKLFQQSSGTSAGRPDLLPTMIKDLQELARLRREQNSRNRSNDDSNDITLDGAPCFPGHGQSTPNEGWALQRIKQELTPDEPKNGTGNEENPRELAGIKRGVELDNALHKPPAEKKLRAESSSESIGEMNRGFLPPLSGNNEETQLFSGDSTGLQPPAPTEGSLNFSREGQPGSTGNIDSHKMSPLSALSPETERVARSGDPDSSATTDFVSPMGDH